MIIADTSIWIEFLKTHEPYFSNLKDLLEKRMVLALSPIFGELLQGVKNRIEKETILNYWRYLPKPDENDIFIKAGLYSSKHKFLSKGIGLIDAFIIVTAIDNDSRIWTLDKKILNSIQQKIKYSGAL